MVVLAAPRLRFWHPSISDAALVGVALMPIGLHLLTTLRRIGYPYELSYFEGSTVEVAARRRSASALCWPPPDALPDSLAGSEVGSRLPWWFSSR